MHLSISVKRSKHLSGTTEERSSAGWQVQDPLSFASRVTLRLIMSLSAGENARAVVNVVIKQSIADTKENNHSRQIPNQRGPIKRQSKERKRGIERLAKSYSR